MPFTVAELDNIANGCIDFHYKKGKLQQQTKQDRPLLAALKAKTKTFPGGAGYIDLGVKGDRMTGLTGYTGDDQVTFGVSANGKRAKFPWKELHMGLKVTHSELKKDGISITNTLDGTGESNHSGREMTALVNLFQEKLDDLDDGYDADMNTMLWKDGTQDALAVPGVRSFLLNDPTTATAVGGIDQSAVTWWRNRASLALDAGTPSNYVVTKKLQGELRQLRRYGSPNHRFFCGSDWITAYEAELRAAGLLTQTGWTGGGNDMAITDAKFGKLTMEYDPTLDDLSLSKYCFAIDMNAITLMPMEGEDMKRHSPARPEDRFVLYRSITWTGGLIINQRNTSGVYSIA